MTEQHRPSSLTHAAPEISLHEARQVAATAYGWHGEAVWLSGERDRNLLLILADGRRRVLKFINEAESPLETNAQIRLLQHLQAHDCTVNVPQHCPTASGSDIAECAPRGCRLRVRAYTFVDGIPTAETSLNPALQCDFGRTAARMAQALAGFDHPALQRVLLWDVMHLGRLADTARNVLPNSGFKTWALHFITDFEQQCVPQLRALPQQAIHGDLSLSNTVVCPERPQQLAGVLDFGDVSRAPRVMELAIAASYALDGRQPLQPALAHIIAGYESVLPLDDSERALLPKLVMARCLQRIVVSEWRSAQFAHNRTYLMRSNAPARAVLAQWLPPHQRPDSPPFLETRR